MPVPQQLTCVFPTDSRRTPTTARHPSEQFAFTASRHCRRRTGRLHHVGSSIREPDRRAVALKLRALRPGALSTAPAQTHGPAAEDRDDRLIDGSLDTLPARGCPRERATRDKRKAGAEQQRATGALTRSSARGRAGPGGCQRFCQASGSWARWRTSGGRSPVSSCSRLVPSSTRLRLARTATHTTGRCSATP